MCSLGLLGYYLASYLDFLGLRYLSAGLERLILFVYPTLVVLLAALWLGQPLTRRVLGLRYRGVLPLEAGQYAAMGEQRIHLTFRRVG